MTPEPTCERITSAQNPRLKNAQRLRQSRARSKQDRILIDGTRELARALSSGVRVEEAFVSEAWREHPELAPLVISLSRQGVRLSELPDSLLAKVCFGDRVGGIVAVAVTPQVSLAELRLSAQPLVVVLEGVEKPGNVGAIVRTADGAGVDAVIVADAQTDLYNPNAIRASLGTIFRMPVCEASTTDVIAWLRQRKLNVAVARLQQATDYAQFDYTTPTALVFGSEAHGVSTVWRQAEFAGICLPMSGLADSLNVSAAAAAVLYEANRQRRIR